MKHEKVMNFAKCNRFQNYTEAILLQSGLQIVFILELPNMILEKFIFTVSSMTVNQLEAVHMQLSEIILVTENNSVGGALKTTQARNSEMLKRKIANHWRKIQTNHCYYWLYCLADILTTKTHTKAKETQNTPICTKHRISESKCSSLI